ncbi:MAG: PspC domain-containing protein [Dysgonamonadaceae bacterium]|jgi:phage shock protein PspC (stress-responsive transcriptional regulator)|nr:PspC domain-containing protein [Dysgonamonadaceae bacterium]
MKKIVTAHLGNKAFQIEDDAYVYLNKFLSLHRNERELEIQVANLLTEKLNSGKQAITYPDVVDALYQLGFSASEMQQEEQQANKEKKLYRQPIGKKLGGVCSGLAEYFDIDPTLVRVLFVVIFFWGSLGLWAYLALWIIMPNKTNFS